MSLERRSSEALERPVGCLADLIGYLRAGEKPPERWLVGIEHEKLAVLASGAPVPYEGEDGIESLLRRLADADGWKTVGEDGRVVALEKETLGVSLEPGAQVELDGTPLRTVHALMAEVEGHLQRLKRLSDPLGIHWLGVGLHPFAGVASVPRVPRERYRMMRAILSQRGELSLEMMHCTAAIQASFDYADEADMVAKMRAALAVTPLVAALFANSSVSEGRANGFVSRRLHVWGGTDPDRTGMLPFVFEPDFGYQRYVEYALDVPTLFIRRGGRYREVGGKTFGRFLDEGHEGERATLADFDLHLTTLFPHVRLKQILEVRVSDAVPAPLLGAIPALWKGLLYDAEAREFALAHARRWSHVDRRALLDAVARAGLAARAPDGPVLPAARELVAAARAGLRRLAERDPAGRDEGLFLEPLEARLEDGRSPGEVVLERWQGEWGRSPQRLIEYARY